MSKTYRRNEDESEPRNARGRRSATFRPPTDGEVQLELAEQRAKEVLDDVLHPIQGRRNPLPAEIARRVRQNAELVSGDVLRDQVLIVLADYRDHSYASPMFKVEGSRLQLADRLMDCFA